MKNKAQIQQVFVYITAILVIGFLVLFGFRMVYDLLNKQCDVSETQFSTQLTTAFDKGVRYGTVKNPLVPAPCDYKTICFIGHENVTTDSSHNQIPLVNLSNNLVIQSSVKDGIQYNVYLINEDDSVFPVLWDERLVVAGKGAFCTNRTGNQFKFWTKGLGKKGILVYRG